MTYLIESKQLMCGGSGVAGVICGIAGFAESGRRRLREVFGIALPAAALACGGLFLVMAALNG